MSSSSRRDEFQQYLETVIEQDIKISELSVWDYFRLVGADEEFKKHLETCSSLFLPSGESWIGGKLPLTSSIK